MTADLLSLRPYQREAVDAVHAAHDAGIKRPAVVLPTGGGKTVVFSHLASEYLKSRGRRVMVLVHRDELADQAIDKLRAVAPHLEVGKVKAHDNEAGADVVVASVQTLSRRRRMDDFLEHEKAVGAVGLVITDECFPAGTLVGGRPIESLRLGDLVPSFNETSGLLEDKPVIQLMHKRPSAMVRILLADGSSFACTPNHPIMTSAGWTAAGELSRGASVLSFTHDTTASESDLHGVRHPGISDDQSQDRQLSSVGPGVLLEPVQGRVGKPGPVGAHVPDQPGARVGPDAGPEPHVCSGGTGQDVRHAAGDRAPAQEPGWQRESDAGAAAKVGGRPGVAHGILRGPSRRGAALPLQSGHRSSDDESVHRSGRGVTLHAGAAGRRPSAGRTPGFTRVAGVQVLEPGSDGTYGGVCPDGLVYNIAVDTTHTYLIGGGVVVHNCHHAAALSYQKIYDAFPDADHVGFTATMARGDGVGLGSTWTDVVYSRSILHMVADGFLVDVRGRSVVLDDLDLRSVKSTGGDYSAGSLGSAMEEAGAPGVIASAMLRHAVGRRSVVFTPTVAMAHATSEALRDAGLTAAVVSGETPREQRLESYDAFRTGRVSTLVNCMVLTEGWDAPWADCAVIARPTRSAPLFVQMVGRVLRTWPGKGDALVLDLTGTGGKLSTLIDLAPGQVTAMRKGESLAEAAVREEDGKRKAKSGSLAFALTHRDMDLFAASSNNWVKTPKGVMAIPCAERRWVFLWPCQSDRTLWDVCLAGDGPRWQRLRECLPIGTAQAWAEKEAEDRAGYGTHKSAAWMRKQASEKQLDTLRRMGATVNPSMKAGEAGALMDLAFATRTFDRYVKVSG